jgi:exodeoxyribonuclease VII large subunit
MNNLMVLSVSDLNSNVSELLDTALPMLSVCGEVQGIKRYASGHVYFTLKDDRASVSCVLFKLRAQTHERLPREGELIEVHAKVTLYEPRGDYQLRLDRWKPAGQGALYEIFLQRKALLEREGLLDAQRKRLLPPYVRRVGIVTSLQSAVLRDVATSLNRRAPYVQLIVYPSAVQGPGAATQLTMAVQLASQRAEVDVLLVCRGGGSMEDLNAFNDESLARAVAACSMPVISGVGHETDTTLIDYVADVRAPTPTAAAELCAVSQAVCFERLHALRHKMQQIADTVLAEHHQTLDYLQHRLNVANPKNKLAAQQTQLNHLNWQLQQLLAHQMKRYQQQLSSLSTHLNALSPQRVLERGYAVVLNEQGQPLLSPEQANRTVHIHYAQGHQTAILQPSINPTLN